MEQIRNFRGLSQIPTGLPGSGSPSPDAGQAGGGEPSQMVAQLLGKLPKLSFGDNDSGDSGEPSPAPEGGLLGQMMGGLQSSAPVQNAPAGNPQEAALQNGQAPAAGMPQDAHSARLEAMSVLERHQDAFGKHGTKFSDIQKMIDDPKTPPDLKGALQTLQGDQGFQELMDGAGAKGCTHDGKFGKKDIEHLADDPELKAYNEQKADAYEKNYISSGDGGNATQGHEITKNDAENELYKYSDYLPKNVSLDELQKIVDGTGKEGKTPPQVIAAAKYFVDHPDEWKALNDGKDKVSTAKMEDNISAKGQLDQSETDTLNRIDADPNKVFGKSMTRESLQKISADPKSDPADKAAADKLLSDPVLFGKLDNAKAGRDIHGFKKHWIASDDGKIGRGDIDAFKRKEQDKTVATTPDSATHAPETVGDLKAIADMAAGEADQPDQKKSKGGGFKKFLQGALKVISKIENVVSKVFEKLGQIVEVPPFNLLFKAAALGTKAVSAGAGAGANIIGGEGVGHALADAGLGIAGTAINVASNTSAGSQAMGAVQNVVDHHH